MPHAARAVGITVASLMASHHARMAALAGGLGPGVWAMRSGADSVRQSGRLDHRRVRCSRHRLGGGARSHPPPTRRRPAESARGSPTATIRQPVTGSDRSARCNRAATSLGSGGPRRAETGRHPPARIRSKPARGAGFRIRGPGTEPTPDSQRRGSNPRGGTSERPVRPQGLGSQEDVRPASCPSGLHAQARAGR
jgi:hypothetical protein